MPGAQRADEPTCAALAKVSDSKASCKSVLARLVRQISPLETASIRRASSFDDLYYPFSGTPMDRNNLFIFNKDHLLAHSYNTLRRGASIMSGRAPRVNPGEP